MKSKKSLTFFQYLSDSLIKKTQTYNRNTNAFTNDNDDQPQLYPHMRKVYNSDTDLLEYVNIIMSTVKPECSTNEQQQQEEPIIIQRRPRRTRISKQRAKVLITEYCTRKISDINKRNYSSLCLSSFY